MQKGLWSFLGVASAFAFAACDNYGSVAPPAVNLGNPSNLTYVLLPGSPAQPEGVLLNWTAATDPNVVNYVVYARADSSASWGTEAYTSSTTYFDAVPAGQYYIASEDGSGDISSGTATVTVDTAPPMSAPGEVTGVGIDSGAELTWSDSVRLANPSIFSYYRVYSEPATGGGATCPTAGAGFGLEGTTVSENFVVLGIANGTAVCYGVTTVSTLGQESILSAWVIVTPSLGGGGFDIVAHPGATVVVHKQRVVVKRRG